MQSKIGMNLFEIVFYRVWTQTKIPSDFLVTQTFTN